MLIVLDFDISKSKIRLRKFDISKHNRVKLKERKMKAITAKQAEAINRRNGMETWEGDGHKTFWATDDEERETWLFDSKSERDEFVQRNNRSDNGIK